MLKHLSFAHSTVYLILLTVWIVPGLHALEFVFGLAHGVGLDRACACCASRHFGHVSSHCNLRSPWP